MSSSAVLFLWPGGVVAQTCRTPEDVIHATFWCGVDDDVRALCSYSAEGFSADTADEIRVQFFRTPDETCAKIGKEST